MLEPTALGGPQASLPRHDDVLTDFGRLHRSESGYYRFRPSRLDEVRDLFAEANERDTPVRISGASHSMNGASLPKRDEVLVDLTGVQHYRFDAESTITVGAGATMWDVANLVKTYGFDVLVSNDGGAAPTVGGYMAAGGIGEMSAVHGGFWNAVSEIVVVLGSGEVRRLTTEDPLFRWMFGAMGQLGLAFEVTLKLERSVDQPDASYPFGVGGHLERSAWCNERHVWFTLFVPLTAYPAVSSQLVELDHLFRDAWLPCPPYAYYVPHRGPNPPLVFPGDQSFIATGIWGIIPDEPTEADFEPLRRLDQAFTALADSHPDYRRYVQSELAFQRVDFAAHFGDTVFRQFCAWKRACDPKMLLGRGSVFRPQDLLEGDP